MAIGLPFILLTLFIPIYFLSKWLLKRLHFGENKNRKYLALLPAIALTPIIYLGVVLIFIFAVSYYPKHEFDKTIWFSELDQRYEMSEYIIESELLIGKTKVEIIELLGKDYVSYSEKEIIYILGFVPGLFNIDPDILIISFQNNKVIKVIQRET